eukprot:873433_1
MYRLTMQRINTALIHKKRLSGNATRLLATTTKRSGLQKQVFALYRKLLRTSNAKDNDTAAAATTSASLQGKGKNQQQQQPSILKYLSDPESTTFATQKQFRNKASQLKRRDVDRIEYNIRQGEKYLNLLQMSGVTSIRRSSAA